jgi:hypothetical protein
VKVWSEEVVVIRPDGEATSSPVDLDRTARRLLGESVQLPLGPPCWRPKNERQSGPLGDGRHRLTSPNGSGDSTRLDGRLDGHSRPISVTDLTALARAD